MGPCSDRQATPGVTGSSRARVHIDHAVWYIAIGSTYPGGAGAAKGWVVHPLKSHVSWVQNVATPSQYFFVERSDKDSSVASSRSALLAEGKIP